MSLRCAQNSSFFFLYFTYINLTSRLRSRCSNSNSGRFRGCFKSVPEFLAFIRTGPSFFVFAFIAFQHASMIAWNNSISSVRVIFFFETFFPR